MSVTFIDTLSPVPLAQWDGEVLVIDGTGYDLSGIPEGALLPAGAVDTDLIVGPVTRNGALTFSIVWPAGEAQAIGTTSGGWTPGNVDLTQLVTAEERAAEAQARLQADYTAAIEAHVDDVARQRQYTDAVSCASYLGSTNAQWKAEAEAFIGWRDDVWAYALQELAAAQSSGTAPDLADLIAALPQITWP